MSHGPYWNALRWALDAPHNGPSAVAQHPGRRTIGIDSPFRGTIRVMLRGAKAAPVPRGAPGRSVAVAQSLGMRKTPVNGTIQLLGLGAPEQVLATPSGNRENLDLLEYAEFTGDIAGPVTLHSYAKLTCDATHLNARSLHGMNSSYGAAATSSDIVRTSCAQYTFAVNAIDLWSMSRLVTNRFFGAQYDPKSRRTT